MVDRDRDTSLGESREHPTYLLPTTIPYQELSEEMYLSLLSNRIERLHEEPNRAKMKCKVQKWHSHSQYGKEHIQVAEEIGLNRRECAACGIRSDGYNFHIHHINGNHNDNNPKNLQILCPECHWKHHHPNEPMREPFNSDDGYDLQTNHWSP